MMSTYMAKAGQIDRKWYVIDAAGKPLGRVAAQAAVLLRGKHKPEYTPHVDCGDHVIIMSYASMSPEEAKDHKPHVVFVDDANRIQRTSRYEKHGLLSDNL